MRVKAGDFARVAGCITDVMFVRPDYDGALPWYEVVDFEEIVEYRTLLADFRSQVIAKMQEPTADLAWVAFCRERNMPLVDPPWESEERTMLICRAVR